MFILFGAGAAGRYALKFLREQGQEILCFADNHKGGDILEGVVVLGPELAAKNNPDATWIACAISRPAALEIRAQIKQMGVKTRPLWECIPVFHGLPPQEARDSISHICGDVDSMLVFNDQCIFRKNTDYDAQDTPTPCSEIYFPDFITHLDGEVFFDCGACDGDTVELFLGKWEKYKYIVAFEPDRENYKNLADKAKNNWSMQSVPYAVGDKNDRVGFISNGDYSSHIGEAEDVNSVVCVKLDDYVDANSLRIPPPTYIKMDIESYEPEALWGARKTIKEYSPVLAICAYHTSDHIWQIPLLIHAINPTYKLFFRRYAEGAWEIVWYAVPPDRIKETKTWSDVSYSDNHTG